LDLKSTVNSALQILYLEDDLRDAELVQATLEAEDVACHITRVETESDFVDSLVRSTFDLILADYTLPSFDGISALKIAKELRPEAPFIFVTGTLGEEVAIEALKLGATDYVFKTGLSRIVPSMRRALGEAKERTERKRAEEALRRNEAYLAEAQRLSHTGSFGWQISSGKIYWSEETFRIFEFEPETELTLERILERIHPEDRQRVQQILDSGIQNRKDFDFEHRLLMPDGSIKHLRITSHHSDASGSLEFVGSITDITERKQAESLLAAEKRSLEMIASGASLTAILEDLCAAIEAQSPQVISSVLLMGPDGRRLWPAAGPKVPLGWTQAIAGREIGPRAGSCGTAAFFKKRVITSDIANDPLWVDYRDLALSHGLRASWSQPLISRNHEVLGTFAMYYTGPRSPNSSDLQLIEAAGHIAVIAIERRRAEEALRRSEQRLRDVIETIPTMAWTTQPDGANDFANQRWQEYTGISSQDTSGSGWKAAFHPADVDVQVEKWRTSLATGQPFENEARVRRASDGRYRWFLHRGVPLRDESGEIVKWYGTATDIEDRKLAEQTLRTKEAYLAEAQRLSHSGSWAWNVRTRQLFWSKETFHIFGLEETTTPTSEIFLQRIHPEDRPTIEPVDAALLAGREAEYNYRIMLPDGSVKYVRSVAHPVTDDDGRVIEFVGTVIDVTEQRNAHDALKEAFEEIKLLRDRLYRENIALRDEVDKASMFEEIVGDSPALQALLARVSKVAPSDSTVLLIGETGTGKELIARAIHKRSRRSSRAFVTVNCAATPTSLIASELFGHEKGAFTGALQRRLGRFELAEGGTIFLDEVGELPMETQITLLRVLQEREFERVGGDQSIRADVRVIAATNRDLQAAIASGAFRSDLFYRLNVIPLEVPPLRGRKEDIPMLIEYFINRYSRKAGKKIRSIEKKTLELLQSYSWPGNIRELQNVIERSVVVSETEVFSVDQGWLSHGASPPRQEDPGKSMGKRSPAEEKETIEAALAEAQGRVSGPWGAAAQLGVPPSTLESRIRTLKINKYRFKRA
jgi:PAS domain S-box-containing protein